MFIYIALDDNLYSYTYFLRSDIWHTYGFCEDIGILYIFRLTRYRNQTYSKQWYYTSVCHFVIMKEVIRRKKDKSSLIRTENRTPHFVKRHVCKRATCNNSVSLVQGVNHKTQATIKLLSNSLKVRFGSELSTYGPCSAAVTIM